MSERITFDLDGTLRDERDESLRPGAERLLSVVRAAGKEPVLWTSGMRKSMERFFERYPHLRSKFSRVMSYEDGEKLAEGQPSRIRNILLLGAEGGKLPKLVGSSTIIDNAAADMQQAARDFGFRVIDSRELPGDTTPDAWAARVATAILGSSE